MKMESEKPEEDPLMGKEGEEVFKKNK